jgi:hypothetical protein
MPRRISASPFQHRRRRRRRTLEKRSGDAAMYTPSARSRGTNSCTARCCRVAVECANVTNAARDFGILKPVATATDEHCTVHHTAAYPAAKSTARHGPAAVGPWLATPGDTHPPARRTHLEELVDVLSRQRGIIELCAAGRRYARLRRLRAGSAQQHQWRILRVELGDEQRTHRIAHLMAAAGDGDAD